MGSGKNKYHVCIAEYFAGQPLFFDGDKQKKPNIRKCMELPYQQTTAELWDKVTDTLCNLDFIQAKACAKMTYDLVKDFNDVLEVIPDNAENIRQERERQARLDKYIRDLIAYAKGKIQDLEIPETVPLISEEEINAEIERIKANPTRLDRLKYFINFLGHEAGNLQNYGNEFPHFTVQQAWNWTNSGPVEESAAKTSYKEAKYLMLRNVLTRAEWEPASQVILYLKGNATNVRAVAITPDCKKGITVSGKPILGINNKMCIVWDLKTGQPIHELYGHNKQVNAVAMTPDGKYAITGSADYTCILWDLINGQIIHTLRGHTNIVTSVAIRPDGRIAISGSMDKLCIVWDLESGQATKILKGHNNEVGSVAITSDGKKAVSCEAKSIYFNPEEFNCITWDLITGRSIHILVSQNNPINALSITPDGKRAILGSTNKTCSIWDLVSGKVINILKGHSGSVQTVSITPDGKRAISGSSDKTNIIWNIDHESTFKKLTIHKDGTTCIDVTPDGTIALAGIGNYFGSLINGDPICLLYKLGYSKRVNNLKGHKLKVNKIAFSMTDRMLITASDDTTLIKWDISTMKEIQNYKGHASSVVDLSITHSGTQVVSVSDDRTCIIWDLVEGKSIKTLTSQIGSIWNVNVTPDWKKAISRCSNNFWVLWDLFSGKVINVFEWNYGPFVFSQDGKMIFFGSGPRVCQMFGLNIENEIITHNEHTSYVSAVSITPDNKIVISVSYDKTCIVWNLNAKKKVYTFRGHDKEVDFISITRDGRRLISRSWDLTLIIWDLKTGKEINRLKGHTNSINAVILTPDCRRAITTSTDNTCVIWDLESGKQLARFIADSEITSSTFAGNNIVLGCKSGELILIDAEVAWTQHDKCSVTIQYIWDFELDKYLPLSADCPMCSYRFSPPTQVIETIDSITKKAALKPEQSPCLELPDEAWEDPGLLGSCPKCGAALKFNPFIAGGDY